MEDSSLVGFSFEGVEVRTVTMNDEPWFVASDVCKVLELGNTSQALSRLDEDEKNTIISNDTIIQAGNPNVSIINESGLYSLILSSRKPNAKRFKKWVTGEVLPTIHKHGVYATPETIENMLANPDTMIQTLQALKTERVARQLAEAKAKEAIRTKAHITAGREAQAMGRVGGLTRALNDAKEEIEDQGEAINILVKEIEDQIETIEDLEGKGNFSTIDENGYWLKKYVVVSKTKGIIGMLITKISRLNGFPIDRFRKFPTQSPDIFTDVKVYHNEAWASMKDLLDKDKSVCGRHRIDTKDVPPAQDYLF